MRVGRIVSPAFTTDALSLPLSLVLPKHKGPGKIQTTSHVAEATEYLLLMDCSLCKLGPWVDFLSPLSLNLWIATSAQKLCSHWGP